MVVDDLSSGFQERSIILEVDLKGFSEEGKLSVCALVLVKGFETLVQGCGRFAVLGMHDIGFGNVTSNKSGEGIIVVLPNMICIR